MENWGDMNGVADIDWGMGVVDLDENWRIWKIIRNWLVSTNGWG